MNVKELVEKLTLYNNHYANGEPLVSDKEYDDLYDKLYELDPKNAFFKKIGCKANNNCVKLPYHLGSQTKIKTSKALDNWMKKYNTNNYVISEKLDGISAYKSLEIIRLLRKGGVIVKTILTKSGAEFVTPLSITSLSQGKTYQNLFSLENEIEMDHISLSRWADLILIAPATANTISKLANGSSDDLASTVALASNKKIFIAPAMNVRMWDHQSTKQNMIKLKTYNYSLIGPEIGDMACGEYGEGKMSSFQWHLLVLHIIYELRVNL